MSRRPFARVGNPTDLPRHLRGGVVAIGNFDGVHRGHRSVLDRARALAERKGVPALALTFEPHPRSVFRPEQPVFRITPANLRSELIRLIGFDGIVEQEFTKDFASQSAEEFVSRILMGGFGISHAVTGFDFHFGKDRQGGPAYLMAAGERHGFGVTLIDAFRDEGAEIVSSSRIRALLAAGEVAEAAGLLGYRYTVEAEITRGKQLGRTLGYPTANMALPPETDLKHGIYAVRLRREDGTLYDGVASFGRRPTVDEDGDIRIAHDNLYAKTARVSIFGYLRGEEKFASLDDLVVQMKRDEQEARALLSGVRPLSELDGVLAF